MPHVTINASNIIYYSVMKGKWVNFNHIFSNIALKKKTLLESDIGK